MKDRANEGLVWNAFHLLAFLIGLGCVIFAESRAAEVGSGSWGSVEVIEASKDVLGAPSGTEARARDGAEMEVGVVEAAAVAAVVGAGAGRWIMWSTMEPGRPSWLSSFLMLHSTMGQDAAPV